VSTIFTQPQYVANNHNSNSLVHALASMFMRFTGNQCPAQRLHLFRMC